MPHLGIRLISASLFDNNLIGGRLSAESRQHLLADRLMDVGGGGGRQQSAVGMHGDGEETGSNKIQARTDFENIFRLKPMFLSGLPYLPTGCLDTFRRPRHARRCS
jgi:hypothetical protein